MHRCIRTHTHTHIQTYKHTNITTYKHSNIQTNKHKKTHKHTNKHKNKHTNIHTHTNIQCDFLKILINIRILILDPRGKITLNRKIMLCWLFWMVPRCENPAFDETRDKNIYKIYVNTFLSFSLYICMDTYISMYIPIFIYTDISIYIYSSVYLGRK